LELAGANPVILQTGGYETQSLWDANIYAAPSREFQPPKARQQGVGILFR
jgi:hypothetical protein